MTPDNNHPSSPPRMDDGRHFTDYRSNCLINNILVKNNKLHSSHDYKQFLVDNSDKLRELNWNYACQKNCHNECPNSVDIPFQNEIVCNNTICVKKNLNPNGVGIKINNGNLDEIFKNEHSNIRTHHANNNCRN